jgi:hypothetical protein
LNIVRQGIPLATTRLAASTKANPYPLIPQHLPSSFRPSNAIPKAIRQRSDSLSAPLPSRREPSRMTTFSNVSVFDLCNRRADDKPGSPIQLAFTGGFIV